MSFRVFKDFQDWKNAVTAAGLVIMDHDFVEPSTGGNPNYEELVSFAYKPLTQEEMAAGLLLENQPQFGMFSFYPVNATGGSVAGSPGILYDDSEEFCEMLNSYSTEP